MARTGGSRWVSCCYVHMYIPYQGNYYTSSHHLETVRKEKCANFKSCSKGEGSMPGFVSYHFFPPRDLGKLHLPLFLIVIMYVTVAGFDEFLTKV